MRRLAVIALFLGACDVGAVQGGGGVGPGPGPDAGGGGDDPGAASFESVVKPLVTRCLSCHSGSQSPTLSSYTALQAKYKTKPGASNILVTKGDHSGVTYFGAAEKDEIAGWIESLP